jgi:hypothetical protein
MAEETFRPRRPAPPQREEPFHDPDMENQEEEETQNPMARMEAIRRAEAAENQGEFVAKEAGAPFQIQGNMPPALAQAIQRAKNGGATPEPKRGFSSMGGGEKQPQRQQPRLSNEGQNIVTGSEQLKQLVAGLKGATSVYEEIELPSKGRFYDGSIGPTDGVVNIRPMTGEEEQILATPRFVRKGQAVNMIFQRCLRENYRTDGLLTIDRTFLLIYLRGISYGSDYDVEVKCPECEKKFATTLDLNSLFVEPCPDDYGPDLADVMPTSKYKFNYRLSTGKDEQELQDYRDRRTKIHGDSSSDDTLTYRTAQLLNDIEGLSDKRDLQTLIKSLPINDVSYIRGCLNEPPFGVDTDVEIVCPLCLHDFRVDLPLEANFFFPRRKKSKLQV